MASLLSVAVLITLLGSVDAIRAKQKNLKAQELAERGSEASFLTQASTQASPFTAYCQWRQTGGCSPTGPRQPDKDNPCTTIIPTGSSGFCDCNGNGKQDAGEEGYNCGRTARACLNVCRLPCKSQSNCALLPDAVCDGSMCKVKSQWPNFGGKWQSDRKLTIKQDWDKITFKNTRKGFFINSMPELGVVVGGDNTQGGGLYGPLGAWVHPFWDGEKLKMVYRGHRFRLLESQTWYLETPQKLVEIHTSRDGGTTKKFEYTCIGGACMS
jgi:hypothetical protein